MVLILVLTASFVVATRTLLKISGYVSQEDILMGSLTPLELLRFTAALRLPQTMSSEEKEQRVIKILRKLLPNDFFDYV
jgi:ATP-binding cassette subfamily G (WHITE) protein 2